MFSDDVPFEVLDNYPETGDLTDQTGGDTIEPQKGVRFTIQNVEPRIGAKDGVNLTAKLNVRVSVGPLGVDGNGKYAGKNLFAELLTWFNEAMYTSDWWKKQARFPYKSFLKALGYDPATPPQVNDSLIQSLKGKEFLADIVKVPIQTKTGEVNEKGKAVYANTGDNKNELKNFKKAE